MPKIKNRVPGVERYEGKWRARHYTPDGKRSSRTFATQDEAIRWRNEQIRAVQRGEWIDPKQSNITFEAWVVLWKQSKSNITEKTWASYESQIRKHLMPTFGSMKITAITHQRIGKWQAESKERGEGITSLNRSLGLLSQILQAAVLDGRLSRNPAKDVPNLRVAKSQNSQVVISNAELRRLVELCGDYGPMVMLTGLTGMRWGEVTALEVRDVNPLHKSLSITKAHTTDRHGKVVVGPTKTNQHRAVDLSVDMLEALAPFIEGRDPSALLFTGPRGGVLNYEWFTRKVWKPAVKQLGVPDFGFHGLRHSCASLLASLGTPAAVVAGILGHADVRTTLQVYTHLYESDKAQYMERLANAYADAGRSPLGIEHDLGKSVSRIAT